MRVRHLVAGLAVAGCGSPSSEQAQEPAKKAEAAPVEPGDPARVEGRWAYRTESNCGSVDGVGELRFEWEPASGSYSERGCVFWGDSGNTIYWWGHPRFDDQARRLVGRNQNSLGDFVDGGWSLEGDGPERLVVTWNQTNGCHGRGVASRSKVAPALGGAAVIAWLAFMEDDDGPAGCDATKAGPHMWPGER